MKKVIGVAVAASLLAGVAFADVSINMRARERLNAYHSVKPQNGDTKTYLFDMDGEQKHAGSDVFKDDIILNTSTDYAGVQLKWSVENNTSAPKAGTYNAWMKFGGLKFTFGSFDSRFVEKYSTTVVESGLLDSDYTKYGITQLIKASKIGLDAADFSAVESSRKNALVADYTIDAGDGKVLLKAGLINNKDKKYDASEANKTQYAGYAFEADFQFDAVDLQALVKKLQKDELIFGVYAEPKVLPVKTAFGFTYALANKQSFTYGGQTVQSDTSAFAIDARVQYPVSDALKLTAFAKFEQAKVKELSDADMALAAGLTASYVVSDKATAQFDVLYANADLDDKAGAGVGAAESKISVRPAVILTAGKGAAVTAAFQYDNYLKDTADNKNEFSIPVIFRVQL